MLTVIFQVSQFHLNFLDPVVQKKTLEISGTSFQQPSHPTNIVEALTAMITELLAPWQNIKLSTH